MPKMKTHRGAAKRFKLTATGKVRHGKAFGSHILTSKSTKRKRRIRQNGILAAVDTGNVRRMLPYL
ncbi:50S ribosomal protein L35 [Candidatus Electronema sp. JC]|jgi:large subunit ribosomal protein L35|uniref:50S ribosomal protein L35 n=1 Tax=Candidatus Electronema sp. JC TaxID=3401570 RepID=UPI003AA9078A